MSEKRYLKKDLEDCFNSSREVKEVEVKGKKGYITKYKNFEEYLKEKNYE